MKKHGEQTSRSPWSTDLVRQLDLLPEEFHDEVETTRVRALWTLAFSLLLIALGNLVFTDWLRVEAASRYATLLKSQVEPVIKFRDAAREQITVNETLDRWIKHVESARPDDSLLQTLAAITTSIKPHSHDTLIDSIDIRLATEVSNELTANAMNANGADYSTVNSFVIHARMINSDSVHSLVSRLQEQSRIDGIKVDSHDSNDELSRFKFHGEPRAARILP